MQFVDQFIQGSFRNFQPCHIGGNVFCIHGIGDIQTHDQLKAFSGSFHFFSSKNGLRHCKDQEHNRVTEKEEGQETVEGGNGLKDEFSNRWMRCISKAIEVGDVE